MQTAKERRIEARQGRQQAAKVRAVHDGAGVFPKPNGATCRYCEESKAGRVDRVRCMICGYFRPTKRTAVRRKVRPEVSA